MYGLCITLLHGCMPYYVASGKLSSKCTQTTNDGLLASYKP